MNNYFLLGVLCEGGLVALRWFKTFYDVLCCDRLDDTMFFMLVDVLFLCVTNSGWHYFLDPRYIATPEFLHPVSFEPDT